MGSFENLKVRVPLGAVKYVLGEKPRAIENIYETFLTLCIRNLYILSLNNGLEYFSVLVLMTFIFHLVVWVPKIYCTTLNSITTEPNFIENCWLYEIRY